MRTQEEIIDDLAGKVVEAIEADPTITPRGFAKLAYDYFEPRITELEAAVVRLEEQIRFKDDVVEQRQKLLNDLDKLRI